MEEESSSTSLLPSPSPSPSFSNATITLARTAMATSSISNLFQTSLDELKALIGTGSYNSKDVHMSLLKLREANRSLSFLLRNKKKQVQQTKNAVDKVELSRQNSLYEKDHLRATIEDVQRHESIYLRIPLEQLTSDNIMDMDGHQLMFYRLKNELEGRKALSDKLKSYQDTLELSKSRLVLKRKELERLCDQIESIVTSADPLINSHSKLFAELDQKMTIDASSNEEMLSIKNKSQRALELLLQHFITFSEHHQDIIKVQYFDEIEPGEEVLSEEDLDEEGEETSTPLDSTRGGHSRFTNHTTSLNRRNFNLAYIQAEIQSSLLGNGDELTKVYFYNVSNLLVAQIKVPLLEMDKAAMETFLLSLPLDPSMLLTVSNDLIIPGESGFVPFRWIQCLSGILSTESAFDDPTGLIEKFIQAIISKIQSSLGITAVEQL